VTAPTCGYVLFSSPQDGQLVCERPKGHKGDHRLTREQQREASVMTARFMRRAFEKQRPVT
jgi:hypothetical protein